MNLEEFFNLRKHCPFCGKELLNKMFSPHRHIPVPFLERVEMQLRLAAKGFFFPTDKTKIQVEQWVRLEGSKFFSDLSGEVELDLTSFNDCARADASCHGGDYGSADYHFYCLETSQSSYWNSTHNH